MGRNIALSASSLWTIESIQRTSVIKMEIEFTASLPDIQSAINIGGDGATRIKLDIPESELAEAVKLVLLKGQAFKVKIETAKQEW